MPQPEGHHRWTKPGERAVRPRAGLEQACQRCGLVRRAILIPAPANSFPARFGRGQIWSWQYVVGGKTFNQRPACKLPDRSSKWKKTDKGFEWVTSLFEMEVLRGRRGCWSWNIYSVQKFANGSTVLMFLAGGRQTTHRAAKRVAHTRAYQILRGLAAELGIKLG